MPREIKFRVWHCGKMKFPGDEYIEAIYFDAIPWDAGRNGELMQFTGLKDRNAKDLYEGDICFYTPPPMAMPFDPPSYGEIYWLDTPNENGWYFRGKGHRYNWNINRQFSATCLELKGNVFENPELIK